MAGSLIVPIDVSTCEIVSGELGWEGVLSGLTTLRRWCDQNTPGYRYNARQGQFRFVTEDQCQLFRLKFRTALVGARTATGVMH